MSPRPAVDLPDLEPARWIWYPSERTLPNTFLLFRREFDLSEAPVSARGWISAESRYLLAVNGSRVQWGPAPCDPRWPEADPFDLAPLLRPGKNVLGATVLYYGHGDGTWPVGKPGFLLRLECVFADGRREIVVSDAGWQVHLSRAWPPGQYKRWYLRALQEEFDSRLHPHGWTTAVFRPTPDWLAAMPLRGSPNRPALAASGQDYTQNLGEGPADCSLRPRRIPLLREYEAPAPRLSGSFRIAWRRPPREYFEMYPPDAFSVAGGPAAQDDGNGGWSIEPDGVHGVVLTFEFAEQGVGWPHFEIDAPAGTTVELLVHEAHAPDGPPLLSGVFHAWSRFICRGGRERFEPFDFESLRWLQLHVHGTAGAVRVAAVGLRRRVFPWPHEPVACVREPALQRLIAATLNTLNNCAQETLVDGMARERQQYSGDCGHQIHALHLALGETRLTSRFLSTFSQGLTKDGYFLDCWPAYDRLARLAQRQLDLTVWGPILDHSVGFVFDCWHTYAHTGDLDAVAEAYPRLLRFCAHLAGRIGSDGLLPVEDLGVPSVWIDHDAYQRQRHKQCAFTLYSAAMLRDALAPLARAFGDGGRAAEAERVADRLIKGAVAAFWSPEDRLFVVNRPWLAEEGGNARLCDRSLATALLHDLISADGRATAVDALVSLPPHLGFSYPANAGWRLWALAREGRADVVLRELRTRWATMDSVSLNTTLSEAWRARPDSGDQWSHCPVAPLYILHQGLLGFRPLEPGCRRVELRPQLADLEYLALVTHTPLGPIRFEAEGLPGRRRVDLSLPEGCAAELLLPAASPCDFETAIGPTPDGLRRYLLPAGGSARLVLP